MKKSSFISLKNIGFEGQFKSLNDNEMINLRGGGGGEPPLPPPSGEDFPIDWSKGKVFETSVTTTRTTTRNLPVTPAAVYLGVGNF